MRRLFTTLLIAITATTMMAQMQIWYNGAIVYQRDYKMIDSVTFAMTHNEGQDPISNQEALTPEQAKDKLMAIARQMINTFQTNDQRDFIELADACFTKYKDYSWEEFADYFESKYEDVVIERNNPYYPPYSGGYYYASARPNPVAPYMDMMCRVARVAEGKAAPTNTSYIFSFEQDNFIFEADDRNRKWNYLGKSSDNSAVIRFKDAQGRACELKAWREGSSKTYSYTWNDNGTQRTLGLVWPAKVFVTLTCAGQQRAKFALTQELQKNDHAYISFDVELVNVAWNIDIKINSTHGSAAFSMKYGNQPYLSAAINLPLYELIGKRDDQSYDDWISQYEEHYDELAKKIGEADGIVDVLGQMQIKVHTDNVGYAYRDFMNWDSRYNSYNYGYYYDYNYNYNSNSRERARAFCLCFNDNIKNGIYFNSDVKQAEVRLQTMYDEAYDKYEPEGVLYFPADQTTYGFEEYFDRKPFTDLQDMVEDLINKYVGLSQNLYEEVGYVSLEEDNNSYYYPEPVYPVY